MKEKLMKFIKQHSILITISSLLDILGCFIYIAYENICKIEANTTDVLVFAAVVMDFAALTLIVFAKPEWLFSKNEEDQ